MLRRESLTTLFDKLRAGEITRREFVVRAGAAGLSAAGIAFVVNSLGVKHGFAQDATPSWAVGLENATRGEGGELRVLLWQAVTHLSPHNGTGTKDHLGSSFVLEPLLNYGPDGSLVPRLVTQIPSVENGQLAEDLSSVTYSILPDVVWSDGEPLTAEDVKFTYEWVADPVHAATSSNVYDNVASVDVIDELTVKLNFKSPTLAWYLPFAGVAYGFVYPGHLWGWDPSSTDYDAPFRSNPTGTGPYKVEQFFENDQVTFVINELYREPNKPFFDFVNLKGGGDAVSAARAVLQTGEYDYAWNLQVEPDVLNALLAEGLGWLGGAPGVSAEQIFINFTDPNTEVDGERSSLQAPHPSLSDIAVRQALAAGIDRQTINDQFYGPGNFATPNRLNGFPNFASQHTSFVFDTALASQILDDAGWVLNGNVREKDGVQLSFTYSTSINIVRQKTQAVVQSNLREVGIDVELISIDAGIYFDSSAGNDQNYPHFYWDLTMFTNGPTSPFPLDYLATFFSGTDNVNVAQQSNDWSGRNFPRYVNPEYDEVWLQAQVSTDAEEVAELFVRLNDILFDDTALVPLVQRAAGVAAVANRILPDNLQNSPFEGDFWNIANWRTVLE